MSDRRYLDLLIEKRDIVLNPGREPVICYDRQSIGQDIVHAIMESGLVTALIAERSPTLKGDIFTRLEMLVESDERIVPGTVRIQEESNRRLLISVETEEFGPVSVGAEL